MHSINPLTLRETVVMTSNNTNAATRRNAKSWSVARGLWMRVVASMANQVSSNELSDNGHDAISITLQSGIEFTEVKIP